MSLAAVPAWAPVGADAHRYRELLRGSGGAAPSPEVLQFHQERWGHVEHYDDFAELLDLSGFDAEHLLAIALEAGADRIVVTARSADGWCWWDTRRPDRNATAWGDRRNALGELAAAARARGLPVGVHYDAAGSGVARREEIERTLGDDLADLFDRYPVTALSGSWPAELDEMVARAATDAPGAPGVEVGGRTELDLRPGWSLLIDRAAAARPRAGWVCRIPAGSGFGWNRADRPQRRLDVDGLLAHYVDVVGSGGRLRVALPITDTGGPDPEGARAVAEAGAWIRRFGPIVRASRPAALGGKGVDGPRYLQIDDAEGDDLVVITSDDRSRLDALTPDAVRVERAVELTGPGGASRPAPFSQDGSGVQLGAPAGGPGAEQRPPPLRVYRLTAASGDDQIGLFAPTEAAEIALAPLLAGRQPGEIVNLGAGRYVGPAVVPAGVTLRGLGAARTTIRGGGSEDGDTSASVELSERSRLEHATIDTVRVAPGASGATMLGCAATSVHVRGDRATLRASSVGHATVESCDAATISRCRFDRPGSGRPAIAIVGGDGHLVEGCSIDHGDTGVLVSGADGTTIRGCTLRALGTAIHLSHTTGSHVAANLIQRATRAVEVEGGDDILIDGNAVSDADSGALVHCGAANCEVSGNYWELCRIGLLVWQAPDVRWRDNVSTDLDAPDAQVRTGP